MKKLVQYVMLVNAMGASSLAVAEEFNVSSESRHVGVAVELNKKVRQQVDLTSALSMMSTQQRHRLDTEANTPISKPRLFKSLPEPVMTAKS